MRLILLSILFFVSLLWSGCKTNPASKNKIQGFIGMDISDISIQELGSCDSTELNSATFQESSFFLFRIPPNACSSCYNRELSTIRDFFSNKKMPVIVTSFNNCRDFNVFGSNYSLNSKELYNSTSLIEKLDKQPNPYYLILDSSLTVRDFFISEKNNHLSTIDFLSQHLSAGATKIKFDTDNINLNTLKQGTPKTATFRFTNTGNKPFIIYHIKTSCGCTKTRWPKEPVMPNKQGEISVIYDAVKSGNFQKTITLFCNAPRGTETLTIKGTVK